MIDYQGSTLKATTKVNIKEPIKFIQFYFYENTKTD